MNQAAKAMQDPKIAPNEAALVIAEGANGDVTAAVFYGSEIKQNSISYGLVEQLLSAVLNIAKGSELVEDTTGQVPPAAIEIAKG